MEKDNKQKYLHMKVDGYNTSFGIKISSQAVKPKARAAINIMLNFFILFSCF